jgi:hypothetical protein
VKWREFIATVCGAAAWPFTARAQQAMPVIGFLGSTSPNSTPANVDAFRQGLKENGYLEGQTRRISGPWHDGGLRFENPPDGPSAVKPAQIAMNVQRFSPRVEACST